MQLTLAPTETTDNALSARIHAVTISISHPFDDLTADDVVELLVRPALLAFGYAETSVEAALRHDAVEACDVEG